MAVAALPDPNYPDWDDPIHTKDLACYYYPATGNERCEVVESTIFSELVDMLGSLAFAAVCIYTLTYIWCCISAKRIVPLKAPLGKDFNP